MFQNTANFGRFRILKDKHTTIKVPDYSGLTTAFVAQGNMTLFKLSVKVNRWVNYNATNGGTVADVIDNSYHMIVNFTGTNAPLMSYKVRTVFSP